MPVDEKKLKEELELKTEKLELEEEKVKLARERAALAHEREMREARRPLPRALARVPRARLPDRPPGNALLGDPALRSEMHEQLGFAVGPQPGLHAVSANFVHGYPYRLRDHDGNLWFAAATAFSYFADLVPIAKAGYSIFLYDLTLEDANRLRETLDLEPLSR